MLTAGRFLTRARLCDIYFFFFSKRKWVKNKKKVCICMTHLERFKGSRGYLHFLSVCYFCQEQFRESFLNSLKGASARSTCQFKCHRLVLKMGSKSLNSSFLLCSVTAKTHSNATMTHKTDIINLLFFFALIYEPGS